MGRKFVHVERNYVCARTHERDGLSEFFETYAARFGRARSGKYGRIENVQIDGEIDGLTREGVQCPFQPFEIEQARLHAFFAPGKFRLVARTDTELKNSAVAQKFVTAAHDARVRKFRAQIFAAKVGVRVEVHDMQIGIRAESGAHRAEGDEVFSADEKGDLTVF